MASALARGVVLAAATSSAGCSRESGPEPSGQNLLLVTVCGLRADRLEQAVREGAAPQLAGLRARADLATRIATASTGCFEAHVALLSGRPPTHRHDSHERFPTLDVPRLLPNELHFKGPVDPEELEAGGSASTGPPDENYAAAAFLSRSELRASLGSGYEFFPPPIEAFRIDLLGPAAARPRLRRSNEATADAALAWLSHATTPFFLWVQLEGLAIEAAAEETDVEPAARRRLAEVDRAVGRLLAELERGGRDQRTIVVLTADHGEALGGEEGFGHRLASENVAQVPLWIADPDEAAPPWPALRASIDVAPALARRLAPRCAIAHRAIAPRTDESGAVPPIHEPEREPAGTRHAFVIERGELPLDDRSARAALPILRNYDLHGPVLGRIGEQYAAALHSFDSPTEQELAERRDFVSGALIHFATERHPFAATLYARADLVPGVPQDARRAAAAAAVRGAPWYFPAVRALASLEQPLRPAAALETLARFRDSAPLSPDARREFDARFAKTLERLRPR